jgi:hypothetical protein
MQEIPIVGLEILGPGIEFKKYNLILWKKYNLFIYMYYILCVKWTEEVTTDHSFPARRFRKILLLAITVYSTHFFIQENFQLVRGYCNYCVRKLRNSAFNNN